MCFILDSFYCYFFNSLIFSSVVPNLLFNTFYFIFQLQLLYFFLKFHLGLSYILLFSSHPLSPQSFTPCCPMSEKRFSYMSGILVGSSTKVNPVPVMPSWLEAKDQIQLLTRMIHLSHMMPPLGSFAQKPAFILGSFLPNCQEH